MDLFSTLPSNDDFKFNLERDIVFFDIESTGLNVMNDRIIQIAMIKYYANGNPPSELELMLNPEVAISPEALAVHGISNEMLKDKPKMRNVAQRIFDFVGEADLAGYNSDRFDVPMLIEELFRSGYDLDLDVRRCIDVQKIFYKMDAKCRFELHIQQISRNGLGTFQAWRPDGTR